MNSKLLADIKKDGLFATVHRMQLEKRAAMPPSSTFYHPRRTSGVSWIAPALEPKPVVEEIVKPLACGGIDGIDLDDEPEAVPLDGEVCEPAPALVAGEDEPEDGDSEQGDEPSDIGQDVYQAEG
jgi:hypothetical protein